MNINNLPKVILIGRTNVGKSTLFNKLTKSRVAVVEKTPGVTRDRLEKIVNWSGKNFLLVDSGGFSGNLENKKNLKNKIEQQIFKGLEESSLILFLVDAKFGLHPEDISIANLIRKFKKNIILVGNKIDNEKDKKNVSEFAKLGFTEPICVSAKLGKNCGDLLDEILKKSPLTFVTEKLKTISIALVGRPNVGKSSLINAILDEERLIVWEKPGTTRDAVDVHFKYKDNNFIFIDTAGQRKKSKVKENIEFYSIRRSIFSVAKSELVICVVESKMLATFQEKKILAYALEKGKSIIIVVNKWDYALSRSKIKENKLKKEFFNYIFSHLTFLPNPTPVVFAIATQKIGVPDLLKTIENILQNRNHTLKTPQINNILYQTQQKKHLPGGAKILYGTQIQTAPPKFVLFVKGNNFIPPNYLKYLEKNFRQQFSFLGTPLFWEIKRR